MKFVFAGLIFLSAFCTTLPAAESRFHSIVAGGAHFCALSADGSAYCWGQGVLGQLGNHSTANSASAVPVAGNLKFSMLAAGSATTCGITVGDRHAYCWGQNANGQLGVKTTELCNEGAGKSACALVPVAVSGSMQFTQISTSRTNSCAVTPAGDAYCWGDAGSGELGQDSLTATDQCQSGRPCSYAPLLVKGGLKFTSIMAGDSTACGITTAGPAWCWGDDQYEQLGDGLPQHANAKVPVAVAGGLKFTWLTKGANAVCGATASGPVHCWGGNIEFALGVPAVSETCYTQGNLQFNCASKPLAVGAQWHASRRPRSVSLIRTNACALDRRGHAFCWGPGTDGVLGTGSPELWAYVPVPVAGNQRYREIAVSSGSACAVARGGGISCWGHDFSANAPVAFPVTGQPKNPQPAGGAKK